MAGRACAARSRRGVPVSVPPARHAPSSASPSSALPARGAVFDPAESSELHSVPMTGSDPLFARFGREFPAGTVLFREGEAGQHMFVIQSGRVRITKDLAAAGGRTLAILGPGEFFGEMAILNEKARTATAEVTEDARLLVLDARTFEAMVVGNTEIAIRLIKKLSRRLDSANALIEILLQQDPRVRVILGISRVAEEFGVKTDDGVLVPSTSWELASQIGLEEAKVDEVMARLVRLRIVEPAEGGGWLVREPTRLQEFLEFLEMREKVGDG
jgi:CRP-like cAMP-binding protein